jgi:hypothetical protein
MPDAVPSRKRQVSRLRSHGSKGASNKPLYKAPDIRRRRRRESGGRERNFRIVVVEVSLAGNSRHCCSAMMLFSIKSRFVRWRLKRSFQAWQIRVSEITRASRSIEFHCGDRHASRWLRARSSAIYQKLMNEFDRTRGLRPLAATVRFAAPSRDDFDSKLSVLVARFGLDSTQRGGQAGRQLPTR